MTSEHKEKKDRQYLFGPTRISDVVAARELLETGATDIKKAKKGLLISFLAVLFLVAAYLCRDIFIALLFLMAAYFVTVLCAYSAGGGFKRAIAIGGELVDLVTLPFIFITWSIILELLLEALLWVLTLICILLFPYFFLGLMLLKGHKEQKAARKYLAEHAA